MINIQATAEALAKSLPHGPISAWPDWDRDWECEDDDEEDWIVGVSMDGLGNNPVPVEYGGVTPHSSFEIAKVNSRATAIALAAHLNAIRQALT